MITKVIKFTTKQNINNEIVKKEAKHAHQRSIIVLNKNNKNKDIKVT